MQLWYIKPFISPPLLYLRFLSVTPLPLINQSLSPSAFTSVEALCHDKPHPGSLCSSYISACEPKVCALRAQFTK